MTVVPALIASVFVYLDAEVEVRIRNTDPFVAQPLRFVSIAEVYLRVSLLPVLERGEGGARGGAEVEERGATPMAQEQLVGVELYGLGSENGKEFPHDLLLDEDGEPVLQLVRQSAKDGVGEENGVADEYKSV